jgi:exosortase C (VPDSG-CTERM-specific)
MTDASPPFPLVSSAKQIASDLRQTALKNRTSLLALGAWTVLFALPMAGLVRFASGSDLYSHTPLMPAAALLLLWIDRRTVAAPRFRLRPAALVPATAGAAVLVLYWVFGDSPAPADALAAMVLAWVMGVWALCTLAYDREAMRQLAAPAGLLVFAAPFPAVVEAAIETGLQYASAEAAAALFSIAGTPFLRDGLVFTLPGITLEVARECSGVHSTLVLFIVGLFAGELFLRRSWTRTVLALAVIVLGIARNGFRVFTLGQLCVYDDPSWIDSPLHHRGGPIFFALSLVPLFILLYVLRRWDRPKP